MEKPISRGIILPALDYVRELTSNPSNMAHVLSYESDSIIIIIIIMVIVIIITIIVVVIIIIIIKKRSLASLKRQIHHFHEIVAIFLGLKQSMTFLQGTYLYPIIIVYLFLLISFSDNFCDYFPNT